MSNMQIELIDSKMERFLNQMKGIEEDKNYKALELFEQLYESREKIKEEQLNDYFVALYQAECKIFIFDILTRKKDKFNFKSITQLNIANLLASCLTKAKKSGKDNFAAFVNMPYNYKSSKDESVMEDKEMLEEAGLLDMLDDYHKTLKLICQDEDAKDAFVYLLFKDAHALLEAIHFAASISYYIEFFKKESKDDKYEKRKEYNLFNVPALKKTLTTGFELIKKKLEKLKEARKEKEKKRERARQTREGIEKVLERFTLCEQVKISDTELASIPFMRGRILLLETILLHNKSSYLKICDELHDNDKVTYLKQIFSESCFSFDSLSKEQVENLIEQRDLNEIKQMLDLLTEANEYSTSFPIYDILLLSSKEIIMEINKLLKEKRISITFIENNPSIFVKEIPEELQSITNVKEANHSRFMNNISLLEGKGISPYAVSTSYHSLILLMDNKQMSERLDLISSYKLQYNNSTDYSLFLDPNLIKIADSFIELGLGEYIKNHPCYIRNSSETALKRVRICRAHRIKFEKNSEIEKIIKSHQFSINGNLISDEDLYKFIPDATKVFVNPEALIETTSAQVKSVEDREIPELEEYKKNQLVFKIEGITISRQKVLRNLSILENSERCKDLPRSILLFNALVCGSVFDNSQLSILSSKITQEKEKLEK